MEQAEPEIQTTAKKQIGTVQVEHFSKTANFFFTLLMLLVAFLAVFPFIFIVIISFTDEQTIALNGYQIIPEAWSADSYRFLLSFGSDLLRSMGVTILITVIGTIVNVFLTTTFSYALSRQNFIFRKFFTVLIVIPMLIGAGLVPVYIVVTNLLNLGNTIWALILPLAFNPFNIIVMRTFFRRSVPDAILESARIDGASEFQIFRKIVLPLSVPGIATIALFAAIGYWNDWFNALLYITDRALYPLQYLLSSIQNNLDFIAQNPELSARLGDTVIPAESTRMAMVVLSTLPIALSYPFFQKYFIRGLTVGGVKE